MRSVVMIVLRASTSHKVIERLHLGRHILHLGIYYSNSLLVDGFGCGLDRTVSFVDSLEGFILVYVLGGNTCPMVLTVQSFFIRVLRASLVLRTSSTSKVSF